MDASPPPAGLPGARLFDVTGDVVIVTGGGNGIGAVYSRRLAEAGARIVVADIDRNAAEAVAGKVREAGGMALAVAVDIADESAATSMAAAAEAEFGRIDALVNNAGLMSELGRRAWHEIDVAEWDRVMAVNLRGLFLCCRAVYPYMRRQGRGKIVNISSGRVFEGTPYRLHYTTSKAGVVGFTRALAREVGGDNICVNAVAPGLTLSGAQATTSPPEYVLDYDRGRSLRRSQYPDDLVGAVVFLVSRASDFITGQTLNVDGGHAMH
jgi:3-oxoacyl-[acyl-carrier protein] reductase